MSAALAVAPVRAGADTFAPRPQDVNGSVAALIIYQGDLVAGGLFSADSPSGSVHNLARWRDGAWRPVAPELGGPVEALAILEGNLVVGGDFESAGELPAANLAMWDGYEWSALGEGTNGPVYALQVQADVVLYVGGVFTEAGGVRTQSVARYIYGAWSGLGPGGLRGRVNALAIYNGNLVAGGEFRIGTTDRNLARLEGSQWRPIARGIDGVVYSLALWNGGLVAGGNFHQADFVTPAWHVAMFSSEIWSSVGFGFGELDSTDATAVRALAVHRGELVAGGTFTLADLRDADHVARFHDGAWLMIGSGTNGTVEALVGDQGILYAGGDFTRAGGSGAGSVAGYRDGDWVPMRSVPVAVEDFHALAAAEGVELRWSLAAEAAASLLGVAVERAAAAAGPYETRTSVPLEPALHMSFVDAVGVERAAPLFYRLVLHGADGSAPAVGPLVVLPASARNELRVPRISGTDGRTVIAYTLGATRPMRLDVFDVRGRILQRLESGVGFVGEHHHTWEGVDAAGARVPRGVYFVQLEAGGERFVRKLVLRRD